MLKVLGDGGTIVFPFYVRLALFRECERGASTSLIRDPISPMEKEEHLPLA